LCGEEASGEAIPVAELGGSKSRHLTLVKLTVVNKPNLG